MKTLIQILTENSVVDNGFRYIPERFMEEFLGDFIHQRFCDYLRGKTSNQNGVCLSDIIEFFER